ncbi:hypothetical protein [Spirosoma linguale]
MTSFPRIASGVIHGQPRRGWNDGIKGTQVPSSHNPEGVNCGWPRT